MGKPPQIDKSLSDDAKAVFGAYFGMSIVGESTLTFMLEETRPTARTQAALDELERARFVVKRPYNRHGGIVYTPLEDGRPYFQWLSRNQKNPKIKFPLTERIHG